MASQLQEEALLAILSSLAANVPYNFRIRNVQAAPDGFQRSVVSVNGLIPGTLITVSTSIDACVGTNLANYLYRPIKGTHYLLTSLTK